jgi:hypothetical protein
MGEQATLGLTQAAFAFAKLHLNAINKLIIAYSP